MPETSGYAVDDQSNVETRAAHVGGDDVVVADLLRQLQRAHDAAGRAARDQQDRLARRFACRDDAAGGIEHVELAAKAALAQQAFNAIEIVGDFGREIRVEHRRRGALIFADDRRHFARQTDVAAGRQFADDFADALLVRRIAERPQQSHRKRLGAGVDQIAHRGANAVLVERNQHVAGLIDALAHFADQAARHDRDRIAPPAVMAEVFNRNAGGETHQTLQRERVAKAARRNQPGGCAGAFDQRVGRLRGAMAEGADAAEQIFRAQSAAAGGDGDGVEYAFFQFAGCGGGLGGTYIPVLVHQDEIGKRAADIDTKIHVRNGYNVMSRGRRWANRRYHSTEAFAFGRHLVQMPPQR